MPLSIGVLAASLALSSVADAFVPPLHHHGLVVPSSSAALRMSDAGAGDAEEGQGGSRFREMLEKSQGEHRRSHPRPQPAEARSEDPYDAFAGQPSQVQYQQQQQQPAQAQAQARYAQGQVPPPPPPPPGSPLPPGWAATVDPSSGRTYYYNQITRETSWTVPPMPPPPPPMPPQGQAPPPPQQARAQAPTPQQPPRATARRAAAADDDPDVPTLEEQFRSVRSGRREFDTISNAADVYLAQLKRDSTIRSIARQKGDADVANAAFEDESIGELEKWVHKNPHTEEENKQLWAMVGTSEDEEVTFFESPHDDLTKEERESYSGISYKEKMAERKRRRAEKKKAGE